MNYMLRHVKAFAVTSIALGESVGTSILSTLIIRQKVNPFV